MKSSSDSSNSEDDFPVTNRVQEIKAKSLKINELQRDVRVLRKEHEQKVLEASLLVDAQEVYRADLSWGRARCEKKNVLLALQSEKVPDFMSWNRFDSIFPLRLQKDRDILMARLMLDDFEETFMDKAYVPPTKKLQSDKELMLAVCSKNSHSLQFASKALRDDPDVVLAAVQQKYHFAPIVAMQHASKRLQNNHKIVRAAVTREHGIRCWPYISPRLQKNKRLALAAIRASSDDCSRLYEHMSDFPEELRRDDQVVLAAVEKRGSNLRLVSDPDLLNDMEIVMAACEQDGSALHFVPEGQTRSSMLEGENLEMVLANGGGMMLLEAPKKNLMDVELLLLAFENGLSEMPDIGDLYDQNPSVFTEVLRVAANAGTLIHFWDDLPHDIRALPEVGSAILLSDSTDEKMALNVLMHYHPLLLEDEWIMVHLAKKGFVAVLEKASDEIRGNKDVMLAACSADASSFSLATETLQQDEDIVKALLSSGNLDQKILARISTQVFLSHPDVAELAINAVDEEHELTLYNRFTKPAFHNRNVLLAWLRKFGCATFHRFSPDLFAAQPNFKDDKEIALAAIVASKWNQLYHFSDAVRRDRSFMKKAIGVDGRSIKCALYLDEDFELMLLAVGTSRKTLLAFDHVRELDKLATFAAEVRERLDVAETFIREFLRGIAIATPHVPPALRCQLPKLDQGYETSVYYKRQIAEYIGVPLGETLTLLRVASANLEFWGY